MHHLRSCSIGLACPSIAASLGLYLTLLNWDFAMPPHSRPLSVLQLVAAAALLTSVPFGASAQERECPVLGGVFGEAWPWIVRMSTFIAACVAVYALPSVVGVPIT